MSLVTHMEKGISQCLTSYGIQLHGYVIKMRNIQMSFHQEECFTAVFNDAPIISCNTYCSYDFKRSYTCIIS